MIRNIGLLLAGVLWWSTHIYVRQNRGNTFYLPICNIVKFYINSDWDGLRYGDCHTYLCPADAQVFALTRHWSVQSHNSVWEGGHRLLVGWLSPTNPTALPDKQTETKWGKCGKTDAVLSSCAAVIMDSISHLSVDLQPCSVSFLFFLSTGDL